MTINEKIVELDIFYRARCSEVKRYIKFIEALANFNKANRLASVDEIGGMNIYEDFDLDRELVKIFRANTFLLLYNLVESTMTNVVDAIHATVRIENVEFDDLSQNLKKVAMKQMRRYLDSGENINKLVQQSHPIQNAIFNLGYNKREIFSGNVNCKEIFETSKKYGFVLPDFKKKWHSLGSDINNVKDNRNALAHGRVSFEECGQDTSPDKLRQVAWETMCYLRLVIWIVKKYIKDQGYLK